MCHALTTTDLFCSAHSPLFVFFPFLRSLDSPHTLQCDRRFRYLVWRGLLRVATAQISQKLVKQLVLLPLATSMGTDRKFETPSRHWYLVISRVRESLTLYVLVLLRLSLGFSPYERLGAMVSLLIITFHYRDYLWYDLLYFALDSSISQGVLRHFQLMLSINLFCHRT